MIFRISNTVVGVLNILSLLLGISAVATAAYIHIHGGDGATDCQKVLQYPLLIGGIFVLIVSTLGIVGSLCRVNVALYMYLIVTFMLILGMALFTVFALFVTNRKVGQQVSPGTGLGEYKVADFSHWLQHYVVNDRNWDEVKSCLIDAHVCHDLKLDDHHENINDLVFKHFSTTQAGCCKPPVNCGFKMKNATFWEAPKAGPAANNSDCSRWSNREEKLCYDCNSCKGGVLANIRNQWRHLTIFNSVVFVLVTAIYVLGCYAIRNNRLDLRTKQHNHP